MDELRKVNVLTKDELRDVIDYANHGNINRITGLELALELETSMRFSEIINLEWQDIDLDNKCIDVVGKTGRRKVNISDSLADRFNQLRNNQQEFYSKHSIIPGKKYVFVNSLLHRPTQEQFNDVISKAVGNKQFNFKTLRHTLITASEGFINENDR